jgi:ParB family chromosome partitioning protein
VAERVGKQRATVTNLLRLLDLPGPVKRRLREGSITTAHAKALASLGTPQLQVRLADRVARDGLSVRETERLAKRLGHDRTPSRGSRPASRDPNVVAAEEALQRALGTKVTIAQGKKGGRIELHFHSPEEMERVYQTILQATQSPQK